MISLTKASLVSTLLWTSAPLTMAAGFQAEVEGTTVYSWTERRNFDESSWRRGLSNLIERTQAYRSPADFPLNSIVGEGAYFAGDPFMSSDYGTTLLVATFKPAKFGVFLTKLFENETTESVTKRRMDAITAPTPGVLYNWRNSWISHWALVLRDSSVVETIKSYDLSKGPKLADIDMDLAGLSTAEVISRVGHLGILMRQLGTTRRLSERVAGRALAAELSSSVEVLNYLQSRWSELHSSSCVSLIPCWRRNTKVLAANRAPRDIPLSILQQALLQSSYQAPRSNDFSSWWSQTVANWLDVEENSQALEALIAQRETIEKIFHSSKIDRAPTAESSIDHGMAQFDDQLPEVMTTIGSAFVYKNNREHVCRGRVQPLGHPNGQGEVKVTCLEGVSRGTTGTTYVHNLAAGRVRP